MLSQGFITKNPSRPAGYFNVRKQVKNLQADYEQEWMNMISNKQADEYYMQQAIEMARKAPGFPFGAVIVRRTTGEIIAKGVNRSSENPIFHGEIDAINSCAAVNPSIDWSEFDLYTTAEPCPMCQSAIEWAGISTIYYGTSIPYLQSLGWWQIGIRAEEVSRRTPFRQSTVIAGILELECNALFEAAGTGSTRLK